MNRNFPATILEANEYEPCEYYCGAFNHPKTAYCISIGDQVLVGERAGILWLGESEVASMRNLVGKQITARYDRSSIWISDGSRGLRAKRGTIYEAFKDSRCAIEVHKPKLASASKLRRPMSLPSDAFPLAGEQVGDHRSVFLWFSCALNSSDAGIECRKWYPKGTPRGAERYCARTLGGTPVGPSFEIDQLASREGRLILTSGEVLARPRPGEACH